VRAVFLDLDGTIVNMSRAVPAAAPAIARLEATGVRCLIATGRMFVSSRRFAEELGVAGPIVCYQGALIGEPDGTILEHHPLEPAAAREIVAAVVEEGFHVNVFIEDRFYVAEENEEARRYASGAGVPINVVGDLAAWIAEPVTKIVISDRDTAKLDALKERLLPRFGERAFIAKSLAWFLEIAAPGVSKAHGCERVTELLGLTADDCMAFGDGENDIEMLEWAGTGVAVEDGFPELVEKADWHVPPLVQDGVPRALEALAAARGG
jgi:Cof subfamily protein (haloacid dehalogenase superfamily)